MSLRVWLPLDGNLKNQGASNITVTNNSATVNTSGKIGSCYSFAKNAYLDINKETMQDFNQVSICFWIKINSWNTNWDTIFQAGKGSTAWAQYHIGILRNSGNYLCWTLGNGSTASNANYRTGNLTIGQWTHVACTYGNGEWATYLDGNLSNSGTTTIVPNFSGITSIKIGGLAAAYKTDCSLNDFRIYDHCLSAAEVHEIAQGLVLHYKLDGGIFGNSNLYTGSEKFSGSWTNSTYWATSSDTFQNFAVKERTGTWHGLAQNVPCTQGDILTISFWGRVDSGGTIQSVHRSSLGNVDTGLSLIDGNFSNGIYWVRAADDGTAWKRYWGTVQVTSSDITYLQWRIENSVANKTIQVCGFKVEKGNTATHWCPADSELNFDSKFVHDSSGYGHNGILHDTSAIFSSTSARYNTCIKNNQAANSSNYLLSGQCNIPESTALTFSWWMKPTSWGKQISGIFSTTNNDLPTDYNTTAANMRDSCFDCCNTSGTCVRINVSSHLTLNEWHHYALVYNGSQLIFYKDGVSKVTANQTGALKSFSRIFPFYSLAGGAHRTTSGELSDFRIYCTALDADDILALYHTGAKIDNKANIHTYEINEFKTNKLTKTGILHDNMIESIKVLPDGSYWQLVLFHYVDGGNNLFTSANATDCNEFGLFSRLKDIDNFTYNNKYEFYVIQDDTEFRWTQTNKPTASAISGLSVVSGYTNPVNGLAKASQSSTYIGYGSWWGACGCYTSYTQSGKTGIPGFGPHNANGICTRYLALYARIPSPSAKLADQLANSFEFIEL